MQKVLITLGLLLLVGCAQVTEKEDKKEIPKDAKIATFAGGCFWCIEALFQDTKGVLDAVSGYSGGTEENPNYKDVSAGKTGHLEAVQVTYDPNVITYKKLLDFFWRNIDPTDDDGQFNDKGESYKTAIFYHDEEQKQIAEQTKKELEESGRFDKPIVTKIIAFEKFYEAEEYHQDYYLKAPLRYNFYKKASGRDKFREQNWEKAESSFDKPSDEELRASLTEIQYKVTQKDGTEKAFDNEYWDNTDEGIYVDIVSGEPLFSSLDKYKSGTGWPSFTKPLEPSNIVEKKDFKLILPRTEIRSKHADSHVGHVFNDGPEPTGKRYCMNSAALRFIPKDKLKEEGYEEYLELF